MKIKSNRQGECPICNGHNIMHEHIDYGDGDYVYYPWKCEDCSAQGEEWYKLEFVGHNLYNEQGDLIVIEDNMIEEVE